MTQSQESGDGPRDGSLHERILTEIEGRILSGEWAPGYRIPFELDLAQQYRCSRMTVNKVLSQLAKSGLIERRRKSGSYVRRPHVQSAVLEIRDIKSEVQSLGLAYRYGLMTRAKRKSTAEDRKRLDLSAPAAVLEVSCRHFAAADPFCFEQRLINLAAVPEAEGETFETIAPGPWLQDHVPWSAAEHTIRAVPADPPTADALGVPLGTACLIVERRTWSNGAYLTHVRLAYRGDSHELVARFAPAQAKG